MPKTVSGGNELLDAEKILKKLDIRQGMQVGDFGCGGAGHFVFPAASLVGDSGRVYAIDILKIVLESIASRAKLERFNNIVTVWSNLEVFGATKIDDNALDTGLLINILFQTKKPQEIIKEAVRLVKSGGKILIVDWRLTGVPFGPPVEDRLKEEEAKEMAKGAKIRFVEEFDAGPYHYGLIFTK